MGLFNRKTRADEVIDLREPDPAPVEPTPLEWGAPVPCPSCSGRGYLDHIDPFKEIMYLHCTECFTKYDFTRAEIEGAVDA